MRCFCWALLLGLADATVRRALVVVDMTVEQVANISYRKKEVIDTIRKLAQSGQFEALIDSHLWFEKGGPASSLAEMYPDIGHAGTPGAELIPELQGLGLDFVKKYQYSCFGGGTDLERYLRERKIDEVVITGINTDYCVMATALDSFYLLFQTRVVESGVSSFNGRAGHLEGVRSIRRFLGDVVVGEDEFLAAPEAVTIQE
ncbi:pncA [Symbiodinium natans]|uniref:PncA protein n=1 Tax=Symbiodinium natans TaxID=878477 RepID=A0A812P9T8_9DINO|nr:pncA [Symbiodinium natans]